MTRPDHELPAVFALSPDDTTEVVVRVLSALRRAEADDGPPPPHRVACPDRLPQRVPGQNPRAVGAWGPPPPVPTVRDAAALAAHATGYLRGSRRGMERASIGGVPPLMAGETGIAVALAPAPRARAVRRRRAARLRPAAIRLVGLVVWLLPEWERARYSEEFRAELNSLGGRRQLAYVVRLLLSAPALRRSLRGPRRREPTAR